VTYETANLALAASGAANAAMVAVLAAGAVYVVRLRRRLRQWAEAAIDQTNDLGDTMADNDRLELLNRGLATDLQGLRDENVRLLRTMVTGEAS
jgi:hypothetical protein